MPMIFPMSSSGAISLVLGLTLLCRICEPSSQGDLATTPPRGWNSYDSYSWIISEQDFIANAEIVSKKLLQHGYEGGAYREGDRMWGAKDVGLKDRACAWMPHGFMRVDTKSGAGRAFLFSLYKQYADWGVDFVKLDCIFGEDFDEKEIKTVSEILSQLEKPMVFSLSPGKFVTPEMANSIRGLVNMYRITADDWDLWNDVEEHFDVSRDFAASQLIGANGLRGKSWPDLDMLPLGWLSDPGANHGPVRRSRLTLDEQRTQLTLWSMVRSPLMFGGDLKQIDDTTIDLITNPTLLEVNSFSKNNMEFSLSNKRDVDRKRRKYRQVLTLSSCEDLKVNSWQKLVNLVCWKNRSNESPFCLQSNRPNFSLENYEDSFNLRSNGKCIGSSSMKMKKSTVKNGFLSPCKNWSSHQMWTLNRNGRLRNRYSGLCASVKSEKGSAVSGGMRSWVASGRRGEIYFAVFNLKPTTSSTSAKIEDLAKAVDRGPLIGQSCSATEAWSGTIVRPLGGSLSVKVNGHGCALFVISCD